MIKNFIENFYNIFFLFIFIYLEFFYEKNFKYIRKNIIVGGINIIILYYYFNYIKILKIMDIIKI